MSEERTNRPKDNALFQQRLRAWTPMLSTRDACIFFIVTGIIVIGLGLLIFFTDSAVLQYQTDYTNCNNNINGTPCSINDSNIYNVNCTCSVTISVNANISPPVFFYYGMTNYYQNHRQFMNSVDMNQLTGSSDTPASTCSSVLSDANGNYYAPCGQMANAIFNDTFSLMRSVDNATVTWSSVNISMDSDRLRFGKPKSWAKTVKPPSWPLTALQRNPNAYSGDEELMVWLRPSPLPTFRKLHRILRQSSSSTFSNGLTQGNYTLTVNYNYPVTSFGGTKLFIISNVSWLGGKNPALGIVYLVTGVIEILIGFILLIVWCKNRGQIEEPDNDFMITTKF